MFVGTYNHKLDEKGRLFLPAKFRDEFAGGLMIGKGQERCVSLFTPEQFNLTAERLAAESMTDKTIRGYARVFGSGSFADTPDKQGRVSVPPLLREYAGLTKELVVVGSITHVEIWDPEKWQAYLAIEETNYADINQDIFTRN